MYIKNYFYGSNIMNNFKKLKRGICFRYIEEIFLENLNLKNLKNQIGKGKINKWF